MRYISGYYDTTVNQYRLGARYYDPTLGRFTQADPSGQEKHPYAYSACNPINNSDPTGLNYGYGGAEVVADCLNGALIGAISSLVVAAPTAGTSIIAGAVAGCAIDVSAAALSEAFGDSISTGYDYLTLLRDIALFASRFA